MMNQQRTPLKAYENQSFLQSAEARSIRVLCELLEPEYRFKKHAIHNTIPFFGSTNIISKESAEANLGKVRKQTGRADYEKKLFDAIRDLEMSRYYEDAKTLAFKLTQWSLGIEDEHKRFFICSGGGPGIMEAANKGAKSAGGHSIGFNISLPSIQENNQYLDDDTAFQFHYFFIRKFWFAYMAKALVIFPGGFGTLDELFEVLTLVQTGKLKKPMPIIIYGSEYWNELLNFEFMEKRGTIKPDDRKRFKIVDNVDDSFSYLITELKEYYLS